MNRKDAGNMGDALIVVSRCYTWDSMVQIHVYIARQRKSSFRWMPITNSPARDFQRPGASYHHVNRRSIGDTRAPWRARTPSFVGHLQH